MALAISTEEPTTTGCDPNLTCIIKGSIFFGEGFKGTVREFM
jgi:hypothetical protein